MKLSRFQAKEMISMRLMRLRISWLRKNQMINMLPQMNFFSSDEAMFLGDDSLMSKFSEEGVNVIGPCFSNSSVVKIEYYSKSFVSQVVICFPGPILYKSNKVIPYNYNATILEDGVEVPIQPLSNVKNIVKASRVTCSGRVFVPVIRGNVSADKKVVESVKNKKIVGEPSGTTLEKDVDDILKIIKMSDYFDESIGSGFRGK